MPAEISTTATTGVYGLQVKYEYLFTLRSGQTLQPLEQHGFEQGLRGPSPLQIEAALRQWRLAVEFSVFLGDPEGLRQYAAAVADRSRREDPARRNRPRQVMPPPYRGLRVLEMTLQSPWHLLLDLGPAFVAAAGAVRVLFYLVQEALLLPLQIQVQRGELRRELAALRVEAEDLARAKRGDEFREEVDAILGGPESADALRAAAVEIAHESHNTRENNSLLKVDEAQITEL